MATTNRLWIAMTMGAMIALSSASARAQYGRGVQVGNEGYQAAANATPRQLDDVGVDEHLNTQLPLDARFTDADGRAVNLGQYFSGRRPVVLNLAYFRCPMLCNLVSNATVNGLRGVAWSVGDQFDVVTISIDPRETSRESANRRSRVSEQYGRAGGGNGWHYLTGTEDQIARVAASLGFRYRYDAAQNQYAHPAVIFIATPSGKVARYLYGINYPSNDLRLGLLEASEGRSISTVERVILFCYHFDATERRYALVARRVMAVGGAATAALLIGLLGFYWNREWRRSKKAGGKGQSGDTPENDNDNRGGIRAA